MISGTRTAPPAARSDAIGKRGPWFSVSRLISTGPALIAPSTRPTRPLDPGWRAPKRRPIASTGLGRSGRAWAMRRVTGCSMRPAAVWPHRLKLHGVRRGRYRLKLCYQDEVRMDGRRWDRVRLFRQLDSENRIPLRRSRKIQPRRRFSAGPFTWTSEVHTRAHIARFGLNYRFGGGPVVARY